MTKHLVDPELLPALDAWPALDLNGGAHKLTERRASMKQLLASLPMPADLPVTVEEISIAGPAGAPLRILGYMPTAASKPLPAILHIHGGGYVLGAPDMQDAAHRQLAVDLNCAIFSVDYRLAPETPHPGPVEDCYAALKWVHAQAAARGIDPARIGVKGESAGGGLAASLTLLARDRGDAPLAFQHLIYPMIDDRTCVHPDPHLYVGEFIWTRETNLFGWTALLGGKPGGPNVSPYAAAARAEDLRNLPPAFITSGALDLFLEEDLDYARRLTRAGVSVEAHVYPGAFHGFGMAATARVSLAAERDSKEALRRSLHG